MTTKIIQIDYQREKIEKKIDEDNILRKIAKVVSEKEFKTPELKKTLETMKKLMEKEKDGIAIAGPQIGISKRIFLVRESAYAKEAKYKPLIFINPEIIKASRKTRKAEEGCLSVRPLYGLINRHLGVTIEAQDFNGQKFSFGATDLLAQIFQHEIDHLQGKLFIDMAKNIQEIENYDQ